MTPAFDTFVAPARARPGILRLCLGIVLISVTFAVWFLIVIGAIWAASGEDAARTWMERMATEGTPTSVLLLLSTFVGMALGPMLAAKWLHKRTIGSLFGPARRTSIDFAIGALGAFAVIGASVVILGVGFEPLPGVPLNLWLSFLPLALVGVLVQTGAEEILFRGYLQTQLAARFASPLMWMVLPSVLFGLLHFDPSGGANAWYVVVAATVFGLMAADLTRITGSIGVAWGFHFANNTVAILIVSLAGGPLSGLALYKTPFTASDTAVLQPLIWQDIAVSVAIYIALRFVLARRGLQNS